MSLFNNKLLTNISFMCIIAILSLEISGCGFSPIHRQDPDTTALQQLEFVRVSNVSGQNGVQLRNLILEKIAPLGQTSSLKYQLSIKLTSTTQELLIQLDNSATRKNVRMEASLSLSDSSTNQVVYANKAYSVGSYNVVDTEFGTIAAEKNALERATFEISEEIVDLLTIYFSQSTN